MKFKITACIIFIGILLFLIGFCFGCVVTILKAEYDKEKFFHEKIEKEIKKISKNT